MSVTLNGMLRWSGGAVLGALVLALTLRAAVSPWRPPAPAPHRDRLTVTPAFVKLELQQARPMVRY